MLSWKKLALGCLLMLAAGCKPSPGPYQTAFASLVARAYRVVLVEHSHWYDDLYSDVGYWSQHDAELSALPEIVYRSLELNTQQKQQLIGTVASTDPKSSGIASACTFEAHHRLEFYIAGKRVNQVEICFQCGDIQWQSAIGEAEPDAMIKSLDNFVNSVGFPPKRDWVKLVETARSK
ncbi:hypothetical protein [Massilia eburnea]|uniref:hypothetical protein n=1 Tax=Massilia eburnea TaxID=1776165 RepID=UPI0014795A83|nr:hypothetical protein [Massilia eburnea]